MRKINTLFFISALVVIAVGSFYFLNMGEDISVGSFYFLNMGEDISVYSSRIYSFDVAESDDGTLWIVIEEKEGIYLTHYSHEKYLDDVYVLNDFHTKNGILSLGITLLVGISWVLLNERDKEAGRI